jgi:hypothetical protein
MPKVKNLITVGFDSFNDFQIQNAVDRYNQNCNLKPQKMEDVPLNEYISIGVFPIRYFKKEIADAELNQRPVIINIIDKINSGDIFYESNYKYRVFGRYFNKYCSPASHEMGFKYFVIFPNNYTISSLTFSNDYPKYHFSPKKNFSTALTVVGSAYTFIPYETEFFLKCIVETNSQTIHKNPKAVSTSNNFKSMYEVRLYRQSLITNGFLV